MNSAARKDAVSRRWLLAQLKKARSAWATQMRRMSRSGHGINAGICAIHVDEIDSTIELVTHAPNVLRTPQASTEGDR